MPEWSYKPRARRGSDLSRCWLSSARCHRRNKKITRRNSPAYFQLGLFTAFRDIRVLSALIRVRLPQAVVFKTSVAATTVLQWMVTVSSTRRA
jgi:hypothetical protein